MAIKSKFKGQMKTIIDNELNSRLNKFCDEHSYYFEIDEDTGDCLWPADHHEWWTNWLNVTIESEELKEQVKMAFNNDDCGFYDWLEYNVGNCEFGDYPHALLKACKEFLNIED